MLVRLPENSPAALALTYALDGCPAKSRRVRLQINLFTTIKSDSNFRGFTLNRLEDMFLIRDVASDKKRWNC